MPALTRISDGRQIALLSETVRRRTKSFQTNLFADEAKLNDWIRDGAVEYALEGDSLFVLKEDRGFWHLYFSSSSSAGLALDLSRLPVAQRPLTTDLVGQASNAESLATAFASNGFVQYASLRRLALIPDAAMRSTLELNSKKAECALVPDIDQIVQLLEESFDPLKEQIPYRQELMLAVNEGRILVVREGPCLVGLLYYECTGMTSILRYWLVRDGFRNRGIGATLMSSYISQCHKARRFVLWVLDGNSDATVKYRHYGFQEDSLIDIVMTRKGELK